MKACSIAYKNSHADMQIIIAGGGSSKGVKTVAKGKVDIGRASRAIKDTESAAYPAMKTYKIGTDGVVLVVHTDNPLSDLSAAQVELLYKGEAGNWKAVGGSDGVVNLISLSTEHGTYELFSKRFHLKAVESEGNLIFGKGKAWIAFSQDVALDKVAHDAHAIAFASVGVATEFAQNGKVKLLKLDGIEGSKANVASGIYPLSRPLLLITNGTPAGEVKSFIEFMQDTECQAIVKQLGYVAAK